MCLQRISTMESAPFKFFIFISFFPSPDFLPNLVLASSHLQVRPVLSERFPTAWQKVLDS